MPKEVTEKDIFEFLIRENSDINALYEYVSNRIEISLDPSSKEKVRYVHRKFYRRVEQEYTKKRLKLDKKFLLDTASDNVIACSTNSQTLGIIVIEEIGYEERPNVKDWKDISNKQKIRRIQEAELLITELAAESNVSAYEICSFILKRLTGPLLMSQKRLRNT